MTKDQLELLATKSRAYTKASRQLRAVLLDIFPVGASIPLKNGTARVVSHGIDAPMIYTSSEKGNRRVQAAEIVAAAKGGEA